jgi:hypothetical protein
MLIQVAGRFDAYVIEKTLPKANDARQYLCILLYRLEGSTETDSFRWPWTYAGADEAIDKKMGIDGYHMRRERALRDFQRFVEGELHSRGKRLYSVSGEEMPVLGKLSD